ncbi:hypothetical protein IID19_02855 [Patescibacteria group bacterium]|nr:hypothetical protein [Patescibacteria group bacterium]
MKKFDIEKLKQVSLQVFEDSLLPNGALVAAPTHQDYYPKEATNYMYVWPGRDGGFALAAMLLAGKDYYQPVLRWIWDRAEDFQHSEDKSHEGLLFRNYYLNGRIYLHYLQPDQNGTLLWSIGFKKEFTKKSLTALEKKVVIKAADALVRIWDGEKFTLPIEDLWEERGTRPGQGVLTYSLAACATGLESAAKMISNKDYKKVSESMKSVMHHYCWDDKEGLIPRRFEGSLGCESVPDASLAGLVWPFNIGFNPDHLKRSIMRFEKELLSEHGFHRYPQDQYEGSLGDGHNHDNDQAGAWTLLTFWMSIACHELGDKKKAEEYFNLVFKYVDDDYLIPEQLFCCHAVPWIGVKPLVWSHAMALFAAWKLGKLA